MRKKTIKIWVGHTKKTANNNAVPFRKKSEAEKFFKKLENQGYKKIQIWVLNGCYFVVGPEEK